MASELTRIAIVNPDKCKAKKCNLECKKSCPPNILGKLCIEVTKDSKMATISEVNCIGCSMCVKRCPFNAISIINLPTSLNKDTTHRYGSNSFKLHRLPTPRPGQVLGLVGANGTGKSTAVRILSGKEKPNLGMYRDPPDWKDIIANFRGNELQNYFTKLSQGVIKSSVKPQYVDAIPRSVKGTPRTVFDRINNNNKAKIIADFELDHVLDRDIENLSGGELQRFAIATVIMRDSDVYIFDEPSSYLDVRQRINMARNVRNIVRAETYVIVIEHDLAVLDYMSDFVCLLYGSPGAYGVVSAPFSVREGINIFLEGFLPTENLRFRDFSISFKITDAVDREDNKHHIFKYPNMKKTLGDFKLTVKEGEFNDSEIIVLLGENGCGKTSFIHMLANQLKPDDAIEVPDMKISYKPQKISPTFEGTVRQLFYDRISNAWLHPQFMSDVIKPLNIDNILDNKVKTLSGGELQRVAIIICLGKPADIYLIDEASSYLDSEQRLVVAKVIKRFILHARKTAFVVEHDFIMATYVADRVILYEGKPGIDCTANAPESLLNGMNKFLKSLDISFRKDPTNFRPRINKLNSQQDKEQKESGKYFYLDD